MVKTAQPFRAHVLDHVQPQHYPDDHPPYDIAGWTLCAAMGAKFDRIPRGFDGPFAAIDTVARRGALSGVRAHCFLRRRLLFEPSPE